MPASRITQRDELILAQALIFAIDGLEKLPEDMRPDSNIDDMNNLLAAVPEQLSSMARPQVEKWLKIAAWNIRSPPPRS